MQLMSGLDYLRIDCVNCFGKDKLTWDNRLTWFYINESNLEELVDEADDPYMFTKAVLAYRSAMKGEAIGHNMFLDATSSGLQLMACLSGCYETARQVNLVNTGRRGDVYQSVADQMNTILEPVEHVDRALVKPCLMTHFYCKITQETLSELQKQAFYKVLENSFTGAQEVMHLIQSCWNPTALEHSWTMPDGHVVKCKVKEMVNARVEVDEIGHSSFTYRFETNQPSILSGSLCPNVIHATDGLIVREMVRRANKQGFLLAHVHDAFCFIPTYGNKVRQNYIDILCEIADSNLLAEILSQITGSKVTIDKTTNDLSKYIRESDYALS